MVQGTVRETVQEITQDMIQEIAQEKGKEKERQERLQAYRRLTGKDSRIHVLSEELYREMSGKGDDPALEIAASFVLAPVLCMYVDWVLGEAVRQGKERLYFLARDGCQMYQAARTLCRERGLPIECRYLYCSRYALRTAEYHLLKKECLDLICLDGMQVTFLGLVERAGLGKERVWEAARLTGWKGDVEKPLSARQLRELKDWLYGCREFLELVWEESEKRFPLAAGYLRQEGLTEPVRWALVDSGWTGSIQRSFCHLLGAMGCQAEVEGYYFGIYEYPRDMAREQYHPWLFSPEKGLGRMAHFNNNLFESIFSAPEGMTVGYALRDERYVPVLAPVSEEYRDRAKACGKYLQGYAEKLGMGTLRTRDLQSAGEVQGTRDLQSAGEVQGTRDNQGEGIVQGTGGPQSAGGVQGTRDAQGEGEVQRTGGLQSVGGVQRTRDTQSAGEVQGTRNIQSAEGALGDRALASKLLRPLMCRPTFGEAAYFGSYEFWDDVVEREGKPLAPVQTAKELREGRMVRRVLCRLRGVPGRTVQSAWQEGSAVLSGKRRELWHSQAYQYVLCVKRRWKARRTAPCWRR